MSTASVGTRARLDEYDAARGLAILAMVVVNFRVTLLGDAPGSHPFVLLARAFEGRAVAVFIVLAGAGASLLARRYPHDVEPRLRRRALVLFVFGLAFLPLWPADILHYYGVYVLVGSLLVRQRGRRLGAIAFAIAMAFPLLGLVLDYRAGWNFETLDYADLWSPIGFVRHTFYNGFHPVFPWLALYLLGIWLGRHDLRVRRTRRRLLRRSLGTWFVMELLRYALRDSDLRELWSLFSFSPMPPAPAYVLIAGASALVVVLLCFEFREAKWLAPLARIGRLSLTFYVGHVVLVILPVYASGDIAQNEPQTLAWITLAFVAFAFAFAYGWRFGRGPMERLFRAWL